MKNNSLTLDCFLINKLNYMKPLNLILALLILTAQSNLFSQKVISTQTKSKGFKMTPEFERTPQPPNLFVDMEFADANGNGILEAEESSLLKLKITNKGNGIAQGVRVKLINQSKLSGISLGDDIYYREIKPNETKTVEIPIKASINIKTSESKITINVTEYFGYDVDPAYLVINTYEYQKPKLVLAGMEIFDAGEGTFTIVNDGQMQAGEKVRVKLLVQNIGNNIAKNVSYNLISKDANIYIENGMGYLNDFKIGDVKEIWVNISPNKRVNTNGNLPIYLTLSDDKVNTDISGGFSDFNIPILLNQKPANINVLKVKADVDKLKNQVARFEYNSGKYTAKITVKDIDAIPVSKTKRKNAVAVVIGVEMYDNLTPARYAARDADIMTRYFKDVLGVKDVITHINKEVSGFFFDQIFDSNIGQLAKMVEKGETDVFVYYSGHGVPEKDGKEVYLFPSDGNIEKLETQGYSLNKLYENLDKLKAKSVTVIIDACFSGSSRVSNLYASENISNTKGVKVRPRYIQPWALNPNFRVLSSSKDDQTSLGFDASQTGLFTYYIAVGLQGDADLNKDGKITMNELFTYLSDKVVETSKKIRGEQTPQLYGQDDIVLVEY